MSTDSSPSRATNSPPKTFFHHAATICAFSPLPLLGLSVLDRFIKAVNGPDSWTDKLGPLSPAVFERVMLSLFFFTLLGFLLGIVALFGISKYGKQGILYRTWIGFISFALFFHFFIEI